MADDKKSEGGFFDELRKGYDEQDAQIRADKKDQESRAVEGLANGATETVFHPFRWLRALIR